LDHGVHGAQRLCSVRKRSDPNAVELAGGAIDFYRQIAWHAGRCTRSERSGIGFATKSADLQKHRFAGDF
jgi:hypothetical protein